MKINAHHCNCCQYTLPYVIPNEYQNKIIGVFGDSFAGLADIENYNTKHLNQNCAIITTASRSETNVWYHKNLSYNILDIRYQISITRY